MEHRLKVLKKKMLANPEPSWRQDPQKSTTTIGRSLAWTARLNNVDLGSGSALKTPWAHCGPAPSTSIGVPGQFPKK